MNKNLSRLQYQQVMIKGQTLIQQLPIPITNNVNEMQSRILLTINAWQALSNYTNLRYQRARKLVFHLRYEKEAPCKEIQKALTVQLDMAEESAASQTGLYLAKQWQKRWEQKMRRQNTTAAAATTTTIPISMAVPAN